MIFLSYAGHQMHNVHDSDRCWWALIERGGAPRRGRWFCLIVAVQAF